MFEKYRQEAKQKAFIQHHRHTRKYDEGFEMASPRKLPSVQDFVWKTHWRQTRTFSTLCHTPEEREEIKNDKKLYFLL